MDGSHRPEGKGNLRHANPFRAEDERADGAMLITTTNPTQARGERQHHGPQDTHPGKPSERKRNRRGNAPRGGAQAPQPRKRQPAAPATRLSSPWAQNPATATAPPRSGNKPANDENGASQAGRERAGQGAQPATSPRRTASRQGPRRATPGQTGGDTPPRRHPAGRPAPPRGHIPPPE